MTISTTLSSRLIKLQSFKEVTWGVPGAATSRWMGVQPYPSFKPMQKSTLFDEDRGSLQNSFLSSVLIQGGEFNLNMHATYEDIEYILQGGLQQVSPTGSYIYTHAAPTTSAYALQSYTLEYGYDIGTIRALGCIINKWGIKMEAKKQWEASAGGFFQSFDNMAAIAIASSTNATPIEITTAAAHGYLTGDQVVISGHLVNTAANGKWVIIKTGASTFTLNTSVGNGVGGATGTTTKIETPSIADRTVEVVITPGTTLKMEAGGGTLGTTLYANTFISGALDVANNVNPVYTSDSRTPTVFTYDKVTPTLSMKLLATDQVKAFINTTLAAGLRGVVQLKQASGSKSCEIDFAGVLSDDPSYYTAESGAQTVDIKLEGQYEPVSIANQLKVITTNSVSALP